MRNGGWSPVDGPAPELALRFAARVVADPARTVGHWRSLTGGKAVGCTPTLPVPEILHAAGLLPVPWVAPENPPALLSCLDAWVVAPGGTPSPEPSVAKCRFEYPSDPPGDLATALDLLESLQEWAGLQSGRQATEGSLWKSIRAYRERQDRLRLLRSIRGGTENGFHTGGNADALARAGDYLPPEAHSLLLAQFLRAPRHATVPSPEAERGDPLIRLARRMVSSWPRETPFQIP